MDCTSNKDATTASSSGGKPTLLLCMTPGMSIEGWHRTGTAEREFAPYREYVRRGWRVVVLDFGDRWTAPFEGISTANVRWFARFHFPVPLVSRCMRLLSLCLLPLLSGRHFRCARVVKTNQSHLSWFHVFAARLWRRPILLRCGYVHGESCETLYGRNLRVRLYQLLEGWAFRHATVCQVPTEDLARWVVQRYGVPPERLHVVPNFVNEVFFAARWQPRDPTMPVRMLSVGRMETEKRYDLLVEAAALLKPCEVTIVGQGSLRASLIAQARDRGVDLRLPGNIPNEQLPQVMLQHDVFVCTSRWEGHPKALTEAMAVGMPCVGTNAPGVSNLIDHGRTGLLVEASADVVADAIWRITQDQEFAQRLGSNAREEMRKKLSFAPLFDKEYLKIVEMAFQGEQPMSVT
jgi:glycosyltransferase involved in cell wall biosynthesis